LKELIILSILLSGCAGTEPYFEIGLSYPFEFSTDYWVHPDRSWQCDAPWFDAEAGIENKGYSIGIYHYSTVRCGGHNGKPEIYWNGIRGSKRWGGSKN
jgi:hypothetical protein